jgi:hypothetical protein
MRSHPGLAQAMRSSKAFEAIRDKAALEIDAERLYIVRGDTLGDEADLFVETLVRGAKSSDPDDPNRAVYLDLDDELREVIDQRVRG